VLRLTRHANKWLGDERHGFGAGTYAQLTVQTIFFPLRRRNLHRASSNCCIPNPAVTFQLVVRHFDGIIRACLTFQSYQSLRPRAVLRAQVEYCAFFSEAFRELMNATSPRSSARWTWWRRMSSLAHLFGAHASILNLRQWETILRHGAARSSRALE